MRYYIPLTKEEDYFLMLEGSKWAFIYGVPDPFSRINKPPLAYNWAEGIPLTKEEKKAVMKAKYAYTRVEQRQIKTKRGQCAYV